MIPLFQKFHGVQYHLSCLWTFWDGLNQLQDYLAALICLWKKVALGFLVGHSWCWQQCREISRGKEPSDFEYQASVQSDPECS